MKLAHIALWTLNLEQQAQFWIDFFDWKINEKYCSKTNIGFESYFVSIGSDIKIELMTKPGLDNLVADNNTSGWAHIAISVSDKNKVDLFAKQADSKGILVSPPRMTGDGYYEAVIKDPDGNLIEIVA